MLLNRATERRIERIIEALSSSFAVFSIGRELGQSVPQAALSALSLTTSGQITFLEQSYVAGKVASLAGTDALRRMTVRELEDFVRASAMTLTETDRAKILGLRDDMERLIQGRSEAWRARIRTEIARTDREWRALLEGRTFASGAAITVARNAVLASLRDRLRDQAAGMQEDVSKLVQTEMNVFFQAGQVADILDDEFVWKQPRLTACQYCMRLHTNVDGSPKKYRLGDVRGTTNLGMPALSWSFTIGPVHPFCYCTLFIESAKAGPKKDARLAAARRSRLNKTEELRKGVYGENGHVCDSPYTLFENANCEDGEPDVHVIKMIEYVSKIYGDRFGFDL